MEIASSKVEKIKDNLYCLVETGLINRYLIIGSKRALLFDTGYGYIDFRPQIREITDLPLIVVNSHGDPDHALGSHLFDEVYLGETDYQLLLANDDSDFKRQALEFRYGVFPQLKNEIDEAWYLQTSLHQTRIKFVHEGDVFDLGNLKLEVISLPGHSNGSIALLARSSGMFFSGDIITYHNIWHFYSFKKCLPFRELLKSYRKANGFQQDITEIYPAHGPKPIPNTVIDELIECVYDIKANYMADKPIVSKLADLVTGGPGKAFNHYYKNVLIVYSRAHLEEMLANGLD